MIFFLPFLSIRDQVSIIVLFTFNNIYWSVIKIHLQVILIFFFTSWNNKLIINMSIKLNSHNYYFFIFFFYKTNDYYLLFVHKFINECVYYILGDILCFVELKKKKIIKKTWDINKKSITRYLDNRKRRQGDCYFSSKKDNRKNWLFQFQVFYYI